MPSSSRPTSTLGFKYPENRDNVFRGGMLWLKDKRKDDGAEGLWRIHDSLYDLNDFIAKHPGGKIWLELTKGTDITEAFEVHHIYDTAHELLPKFYARKAITPRSSPYAFEEDGFYKTLRHNIRPTLKNVTNRSANRSKMISDGLLISTFAFACMANYYGSYMLAVIAGSLLCSTTIAGHNYFHVKDNFRMYYFDLSLMESREWRITHALSHHLLTNTVQDLEISMFEPFLEYLPIKKGFIKKYSSWLAVVTIATVLFYFTFIKRIMGGIFCKEDTIRATILIPFSIPLAMYYSGTQSLFLTLGMWIIVVTVASFQFGMIGINAAHHHPDIFHDGDTPRDVKKLDWGIAQLDSVMDRTEITGSHYLVLTTYGDHGLHHMFPTLDHGILNDLYPIFRETCKQFNVDLRMTTQLNLVKGQFRQLLKIKPNPNPPGLDTAKYNKNEIFN